MDAVESPLPAAALLAALGAPAPLLLEVGSVTAPVGAEVPAVAPVGCGSLLQATAIGDAMSVAMQSTARLETLTRSIDTSLLEAASRPMQAARDVKLNAEGL
jgi:hypothetical protein